MVGEALREAREYKHLTQRTVGTMNFCSDKTVSAIEKGRRGFSTDILSKLATSLDYPRLLMEVAEEVTGGAFCSPWLDGDDVDLYRTSVWAKTIEELQEAAECLEQTRLINKKKDDDSKKQIFESLMQALDARVAIDHYVSIVCEEYGFSIEECFQQHKEKLLKKGYIKKKKDAKISTRR